MKDSFKKEEVRKKMCKIKQEVESGRKVGLTKKKKKETLRIIDLMI